MDELPNLPILLTLVSFIQVNNTQIKHCYATNTYNSSQLYTSVQAHFISISHFNTSITYTMSSVTTHNPRFATLPAELQHLIQQTAYLCDDEGTYQLLCCCEEDNDLDLDNPVELGSEEQSAILNTNTEPQGQINVDVGYVMTILSVCDEDGEDADEDMEDVDDDEGYATICHCEGCEKYYKNEAEAEAKAKAAAEAVGH